MTRSECDLLDDYLLGWLSPEEAAAFAGHLANCPACRREHALQQSIDRLLAEPGAMLGALPADLAVRLERYVRSVQQRRLRRRVVLGSAIAAAVMVFIGVWGVVANRLHRPAGEYASGATAGLSSSAKDTVAQAGHGSEDDRGDSALGSSYPQGNPKPGTFTSLTPSTRVTLTDPSSGIVIDCKTHNPDIDMVWIYPTYKPAKNKGELIDQ